MHDEHIEEWITALRDPSLKQIKGTLAMETADGVGYCCLGVGCKVAGFENAIDLITRWRDDEGGLHSDDSDSIDEEYDEVKASGEDVPPPDFHQWLGIFPPPPMAKDVNIDWPSALLDPSGIPYRESLTCAGLNDAAGLTFPQIADVIAYFGLRS